MRHYPVFLTTSHLRALVVGAGEVGLRKIATLLESGAASVLALDTGSPSARLEELLEHDALVFEQRAFVPADLDGISLVFACTGNAQVNAEVGRLARQRGILVNIADAPGDSTFIVPSSVHQGPLSVAFSTSGASPAMARRIRREMQDHFGPHYGLFLTLMERIRPLVLAQGRPTQENTEIFRALAASDLLDSLRTGDLESARNTLKSILPEALAAGSGDLLDGLC